MFRFLFFVIIFAIVFAYIGKWVYVFIMKFNAKENNQFEKIYDDVMFERHRCKSIQTHNLADLKTNTKCEWCGKTVKQIKAEDRKKVFSKGNI